MSRLGLIWVIALREFKEQTRSRVFRISTTMTILIVVAAVVFPALADREQEKPVYSVGVVEPASAQVIEAIQQTGPALDAEIRVFSVPDLETGEAELRQDSIMLLVVPGEELVSHITPNPNVVTTVSRLTAALGETLRLYAGLDQAGLDPRAATQALTHDPLSVRGLEPAPFRNDKDAAASGSGMILLFVFLTLYGAFVLNSVIEEKTSRIVEILLATVRPFDLLTGKVLGIGMVGSVQGGALVVATLIARSATPGSSSASLTPAVLGYTLLWFALGFLLFAGLYACAGALVSRSVDAQSLVMPLQVPLILSYAVGLYSSINGPNRAVTILSMIPFTAPMAMLERMSAEEAPLWQIALSITLCLITAAAVMRLAVTIFAGGILRSGQRVKIRDAWKNPVG
jgi:ABC-2 type transport system permease protein